MKKGYVQIYTGDGKGKTTAAVGLAVRCAGRGNRVLLVQFLKAIETGELKILNEISNIRVMRPCQTKAFTFKWTDEELAQEKTNAANALAVISARYKDFDLIILDEALGAISADVLSEADVLALIESKPETVELVLTGRNCPDSLAEKADLITEMKPIKHYADTGVVARKGIEF